MTDCCNSPNGVETNSKKGTTCPVCNRDVVKVKPKTVMHQIRFPLNTYVESDTYFYCSNVDCAVAYFSSGTEQYFKKDLADTSPMICWCFHLSHADFNKLNAADQTLARDFIVNATKRGLCACDVRNPSGKCCLSSF